MRTDHPGKCGFPCWMTMGAAMPTKSSMKLILHAEILAGQFLDCGMARHGDLVSVQSAEVEGNAYYGGAAKIPMTELAEVRWSTSSFGQRAIGPSRKDRVDDHA